MRVEELVSEYKSLLVDETELSYFLQWLPDINWDECYLMFMMPRVRKLKSIYGIAFKESVVARAVVPGYVNDWRDRFIREARKLGILGYHSSKLYLAYKRNEKGVIIRSIPVPWDTIGIFLVLSPSNWVKASLNTINQALSTISKTYNNPTAFRTEFTRIDKLFHSNIHKLGKGRYHIIDLDTKDESIVSKLEEYLCNALGFIPPRISTPHGYHYIIELKEMNDELKKKWFGRGGFKDKMIDLFGELLEYKDKSVQIPLPGTVYQGTHIVRFRAGRECSNK